MTHNPSEPISPATPATPGQKRPLTTACKTPAPGLEEKMKKQIKKKFSKEPMDFLANLKDKFVGNMVNQLRDPESK